MTQYTTTVRRSFFSLIFIFFAFFSGAIPASALTYELSGFGWGADDNAIQGFCDNNPSTPAPPCANFGGLGWISFSNKTDSSAIPYGVFINSTTGDLDGYAWSATFGWITFNSFEMQKCNTNPGDHCPSGSPDPRATINIIADPTTGIITGGTGKVTGWARVCSVFVSGCTGTVRPVSQTGTWDGWISLSGTTYGLQFNIPTMKFLGPSSSPSCPTCFAWSGGAAGSHSGFGWGVDLSGLMVSLSSGTIPSLLSFWADQTTVVSGQSTLLHWVTSSNIVSCSAVSTPSTATWSGSVPVAPTVRSLPTGPLTSPQSYTLQCKDNLGVDTPSRTVNIAISAAAVPATGACGGANGVSSRSAPTVGLCSSGNAGAVTQSGETWLWTCSGISGGVSSNCSAPKKKAPDIHIIEN